MIEKDKQQLKLESQLAEENSELHSNLVKLIRDRFSMSSRHMSGRYNAWRKAEKQHLAYVDPDEVDKDGNAIFTQARDIVVPYTYAVLQTRLTYFFFAMLARSPMTPIIGRGPNDFMAAKIMEIIQDYQASETKASIVGYCFLQDCERYGVGIMRNIWHSLEEEKWSIVRKPFQMMGYTIFERLSKERNRTVTYEGNLATNISPYNFFPDPRCNISDVKRMEFCGHRIMRSYNYLKMAEANGEYFNIDKIPLVSKDNQNKTFDTDKVSTESNLGRIVGMTDVDSMMVDPSANSTNDGANIKLEELEIRVIPRDHKLSTKEYPTEYLMTLANNQIIIKCEPLIYPEKTYYVAEPNHDYASPANLSTVDMCNGLSDHLSWLFNSHASNVRKIVNNSVVVDPSMIELKDLLSSNPVKIVRLKEDYWGRPGAVRDAFQQLQINDITRGHIQDSQVVMNLIQRVSAATDNIMGMPEEVKRTATESSTTTNLATARLKMTAYLYYMLAFRPMFKAQVTNNQGLLTEERYYRITDDIAQQLDQNPEIIKNRILVKPDQLYGNFDFDVPPFDLPVNKLDMAKLWRQTYMDISQNQNLQQRFDIFPVYKQFLYNMGINNSKDFEIKTRVMPDEKLQQMAKEGSLAPLNEVSNINQQQMMEKMQMLTQNGNGANGNVQ